MDLAGVWTEEVSVLGADRMGQSPAADAAFGRDGQGVPEAGRCFNVSLSG